MNYAIFTFTIHRVCIIIVPAYQLRLPQPDTRFDTCVSASQRHIDENINEGILCCNLKN